jgi:hypothetical protein
VARRISRALNSMPGRQPCALLKGVDRACGQHLYR